MRLTLALLKRKMPPGNIWLGKHRLAHHIYPDNINRMTRRLKLEENNMLLLRHPYLTKEQENGHVTHKKTTEVWLEKKRLEWVVNGIRKNKSNRIEVKFGHLAHGGGDSWDPT